MSISFIIPTKGRPSLYSTLHSLTQCAARPEDEVIVVGDGAQPEARRIVKCFSERLPISYHEIPAENCPGGPHRNFAMRRSTKTHFMFIDDDDVYAPGGIDRVRKEIAGNPGKILMFRMQAMTRRLSWSTLWRAPDELVLGNVGTPMFVVPNVKGKLGEWSREYCTDFRFISDTAGRLGPDSIVWVDHVIAHIY